MHLAEYVKMMSTLRRSSNHNFISPLKINAADETKKQTVQNLAEECNSLKQKEAELSCEIQKLKAEGIKEEELSTHIEKLHEYNEIKDITQMLIGRIAEKRGVTTSSLYCDFGLQITD